MDKVNYKWETFQEDIYFFIKVAIEEEIDHIVTLYKGGLPLGVTLANRLALPLTIVDYQSYDGESKEPKIIKYGAEIKETSRILLVDDIADTGNSFRKTIEMLNTKHKGVYIRPMSLVGSIEHPESWYYKHEHDGRWVVFPWE